MSQWCSIIPNVNHHDDSYVERIPKLNKTLNKAKNIERRSL
jgi:hypothetical protein